MGATAADRVALMSIHQRWAEAIVDGRKRVEFRKRRLAEDIRTVLIYATAPTSQVIGQFTIDENDHRHPGAHLGTVRRCRRHRERRVLRLLRRCRLGCRHRRSNSGALPRLPRAHDFTPQPAVPQSFIYLAADARELASAG